VVWPSSANIMSGLVNYTGSGALQDVVEQTLNKRRKRTTLILSHVHSILWDLLERSGAISQGPGRFMNVKRVSEYLMLPRPHGKAPDHAWPLQEQENVSSFPIFSSQQEQRSFRMHLLPPEPFRYFFQCFAPSYWPSLSCYTLKYLR
jgi:hypothetical protein